MRQKFLLLKNELKEYGFGHAFKRVISFIFRPLENLLHRSRAFVVFWYGYVLPFYIKIKNPKPKIITLPESDLVKRVREFWYNNIPGDFDLDGEKISRKDIFTYGGPNPKFTCPICQKSEWLSRVCQKNLFIPHNCHQSDECEDLCQKQGDEMWTHYHQNFDFSVGVDQDLKAPKCAFIRKNIDENKVSSRTTDIGKLVAIRRIAYSFQRDIIDKPNGINWDNYDFCWIDISTFPHKFKRPNIPIILYGHDFEINDKRFQWAIDWLAPDIFLTSYPSKWKESFNFPKKTKIIFYPLFDSLFFARPNLDEKKKEFDLLVIGAAGVNQTYKPRLELSKQISKLPDKYKIEFSHSAGADNANKKGPTIRKDARTGEPIRFLNKWSEYLGSAKYVIFGRIKDFKKQFLVMKYYETLGSGAIPIFPEVPDLKLLDVKPFEHYIPLSEVEGNNDKLSYYLDNYEKYRRIAENAVEWYKKVSDKMIFNDFEEAIRKITNYKYPKRLV